MTQGSTPKAVVPPDTNQRASARSFVVCPISVSFESSVHHGIVRDISANGIFFYVNSKLPLYTNIDFTVQLKDKNITGSGQVVRLEEGVPGAAIGVALKISTSAET